MQKMHLEETECSLQIDDCLDQILSDETCITFTHMSNLKTISIYPCIANKLITIFFLFAESTSRCLLVALSLHASHGLVVTRTNKLQTYLSFDFPKIRKFEPFGRTGATGRIRSSLTQRPSALIISLSVIMMHHISSSEL